MSKGFTYSYVSFSGITAQNSADVFEIDLPNDQDLPKDDLPIQFDVDENTELDNSVEPAPLPKHEIMALKLLALSKQYSMNIVPELRESGGSKSDAELYKCESKINLILATTGVIIYDLHILTPKVFYNRTIG